MGDQDFGAALEQAVRQARGMDAPLNQRLDLVATRLRALHPGFADAVERMIERQKDVAAGGNAPLVGEEMPPFAMPDETGRLVTLAGLLARGPVALSFNRGHWCPYCRINAAALTDAHTEVSAMGGQIVLIVPEMPRFSARLKQDAGGGYTVLSDMDNGYALLCNLAIWIGAEMQDMMGAAGVDLPAHQGNAAWMLPVPATFVVGRDGRVAARHIDPDYRRRWEMEDLVFAMREVCEG
jgi:peroxiredoxin